MDLARLRRWLQSEEGLSRVAYPDSRGVLTLGYGHKLSVPISLRTAELMLDDDIADAVGNLATRYPWTNALDAVRQCVVADLVFNMGLSGFGEFTKLIGALKIGDYAGAANEMLDSRWAQQVGTRAHLLAERMRTGQE